VIIFYGINIKLNNYVVDRIVNICKFGHHLCQITVNEILAVKYILHNYMSQSYMCFIFSQTDLLSDLSDFFQDC